MTTRDKDDEGIAESGSLQITEAEVSLFNLDHVIITISIVSLNLESIYRPHLDLVSAIVAIIAVNKWHLLCFRYNQMFA